MAFTLPSETRDFCNMPTEAQIVEQIPDLGSISLAQYVHLKKLEIVRTTLTGHERRFLVGARNCHSLHPKKPRAGKNQDAVEIGRASIHERIRLIPSSCNRRRT